MWVSCKCLTVCECVCESWDDKLGEMWWKVTQNQYPPCLCPQAGCHSVACRDWSDWSISALICAQQPHLALSQGHTHTLRAHWEPKLSVLRGTVSSSTHCQSLICPVHDGDVFSCHILPLFSFLISCSVSVFCPIVSHPVVFCLFFAYHVILVFSI